MARSRLPAQSLLLLIVWIRLEAYIKKVFSSKISMVQFQKKEGIKLNSNRLLVENSLVNCTALHHVCSVVEYSNFENDSF